MNPILLLQARLGSKSAWLKELDNSFWTTFNGLRSIKNDMEDCQKEINDLQMAIEKLQVKEEH